MADVLDVENTSDIRTVHNEKNEFIRDITLGLSKSIKQIPSKYFYDENGAGLFNQITRHPDYYLTRCELEILNEKKKQLTSLISAEPINLIELGPGEGIKTNIILKQFLLDSLNFKYIPIDISKKYLQSMLTVFNETLPNLDVMPLHADFFSGLKWLSINSERRNFVLFLGSSIGNFDHVETKDFLRHLWEILHHGDYLLIGFDLRKDIDILMRAYNDSDGITRDFNLNLLKRINHELSANFNLEKFQHYATYNVYKGAMESYLVSLESQVVNVNAIGKTFNFDTIEPIHVEYSHKYLLSQIRELAQTTGYDIVENFIDSKEYFVDSLWRINKQNPKK